MPERDRKLRDWLAPTEDATLDVDEQYRLAAKLDAEEPLAIPPEVEPIAPEFIDCGNCRARNFYPHGSHCELCGERLPDLGIGARLAAEVRRSA
jgi:hypothetical protein